MSFTNGAIIAAMNQEEFFSRIAEIVGLIQRLQLDIQNDEINADEVHYSAAEGWNTVTQAISRATESQA